MVVVSKIGVQPILLRFERQLPVPVVPNTFLLDCSVEAFDVRVVVRPVKSAMSGLYASSLQLLLKIPSVLRPVVCLYHSKRKAEHYSATQEHPRRSLGGARPSPTPSPSDPAPFVQPCVFYANLPAKVKEHPGSFGPKVGLVVSKPMSRLTAAEARQEFMTALSKDCMLLAVWSVHFGVRTLDANRITGQYVGSDAVRLSDLARLRAKLDGMRVSLRELPAGEAVLTVAARPGKVPQAHEVKTAYSKPSQILVFTDRDGLVREVRINCYGQPLLDGSKDPTRRFYPDN